ncbi:MAG: transposase [Acidobacteriota bacterium]
MTRPLRLSFENAVYHVTARGNRKEKIFYSENDKRVFLEKLNETFKKYSFICYSYCLMDNHYHLFIKTPLANITDGMHYLNASYTNWFKAAHKIVGVVFQGRYKSILVDEDNYALELSAYIHLNPLRAGIVKNIEQYKWSSFLEYIGEGMPSVERLDTSFILNQLDDDLKRAAEKYKRFILERKNMKNPLENTYKGIVLGSEWFVEKIKEKIVSIGQKREISETRIARSDSLMAEEIIRKISEVFEIESDEIFRKKNRNIYRHIALYMIKKYSALSLNEIGELFEMDYGAVSQAVRRFEDKIKTDRRILKIKDVAEEALRKSDNEKD